MLGMPSFSSSRFDTCWGLKHVGDAFGQQHGSVFAGEHRPEQRRAKAAQLRKLNRRETFTGQDAGAASKAFS